jgi:hypothetical protein
MSPSSMVYKRLRLFLIARNRLELIRSDLLWLRRQVARAELTARVHLPGAVLSQAPTDRARRAALVRRNGGPDSVRLAVARL